MAKKRLPVSTTEARAARRVPGPTSKFGVRKGKYNAAGRYVGKQWCASEAEAKRAEHLIIMETAGTIQNLEFQPVYPVVVNGVPICKYKADFRYRKLDRQGRVIDVIVEDVKGMILDVYVIKKKLVEAQYGLTIHEIPGRKVGEWEGRVP